MKFSQEELLEAKRQNDSTLHKLRETVKTLENKENANRYKSQITLAKRRIMALELSNQLIAQQLEEANPKEEAVNQGRIIIITGSPGTGKSAISSIAARESALEKSVHLHTDDFYHYLSKGAIPPHMPESQEQNQIVIEAFLETARRFVQGGYDVIVDGIVGPWFLEPWMRLSEDGCEVHYLILRASKEETMKRAVGRSKLDRNTNMELVEIMWDQFQNLGRYEAHVIDTTNDSIEAAAAAVKGKIEDRSCLLTI